MNKDIGSIIIGLFLIALIVLAGGGGMAAIIIHINKQDVYKTPQYKESLSESTVFSVCEEYGPRTVIRQIYDDGKHQYIVFNPRGNNEWGVHSQDCKYCKEVE